MKWFNSLSNQIKIILGAAFAFLSFFVFVFVNKKINAKSKMEYELGKIKSELKLAELDQDSEEKQKKITELKKAESLIREKIKFIEEKEIEQNKEISVEELDHFFDSRGF